MGELNNPRVFPDKPSANPIATNSMVQRILNIWCMKDPKLSLSARQKKDTEVTKILERLLELPGTAEESPSLDDGSPAWWLVLQPHQKPQASLFTGARGFGLSSAEA